MIQRIALVTGAALLLAALSAGQNAPARKPAPPVVPAGGQLADEMAQRLASELQVKTVVGEPVKVGSVTVIPILMIDLHFGGAAKTGHGSPAAGAAADPTAGADGFYTSGEARPLGFVVITKKGTRFISAGKAN